MSTLPVELFASIINELETKRDILPLLLVSRSFHADSERALYREISCMDEGEYDAIVDVRPLKRIVRFPHLAKYVFSLRIRLDYQVHGRLVNATLRATSSLRSLWLDCSGATYPRPDLEELVEGVSFQLHHLFLGTYLEPSDAEETSFLHMQATSLRELDFKSWDISEEIEMPNLRVLGAGLSSRAVRELVKRSRIERLRCSSLLIELLGRALPHVRSLDILQSIGPSEMRKFPNLTYLRIEVVGPHVSP